MSDLYSNKMGMMVLIVLILSMVGAVYAVDGGSCCECNNSGWILASAGTGVPPSTVCSQVCDEKGGWSGNTYQHRENVFPHYGCTKPCSNSTSTCNFVGQQICNELAWDNEAKCVAGDLYTCTPGAWSYCNLFGGGCTCGNWPMALSDRRNCHCEETTLVTLLSFTVTSYDGHVILEWETATEIDNAGFHIWRAVGDGWKIGDYSTITRLTDQLILAKGDGASYSYIDSNVESEITYYYGLEDIDLKDRSTFHCDLIESATAK